jgi:uncharacterized protein YqgC (DUF456 family)
MHLGIHVLYYIILLIVLFLGLAINVLGLPGLWLMVAAHAVYALATGWNRYVGWPSLIAMIVLALIAEAVEFFAGAAGSKAAGGRTRGAIGAVVGAFIGAILFSFIPLFVVAQVVGACVGAFVGAAVMEFTDKDLRHSLRVGVGAAKGRFVGIVGKLGIGIVMLFVSVVTAWPFHLIITKHVVFPPPATATAPAATSAATTTTSTTIATTPATTAPTSPP